MDWTFTLHAEEGYLEVTTRGNANRETTLAMAQTIAREAPKHQVKRILIDHRNISEVNGEVVDVYHRPRQLGENYNIHKVKIAELIIEEHTDFFRFFETVCLNRGFDFAIFTRRKDALGWLLD